MYKVPLQDVVDLKPRGFRKLKRGREHSRRPFRCILAYVRFAGGAPFDVAADVVALLLHSEGAFEIQRK